MTITKRKISFGTTNFDIFFFQQNVHYQNHILTLCSSLKIKKEDDRTPKKRFCRKVKASKCVQRLKKTIKNLAEPFEGSEFYPMAEPSPPEPFFKFSSAKKGSVRNIQNPGGSGLSFNGFVRNPHGFVLNLIVLIRTIRVLYVSDRTFFALRNLKKGSGGKGSAIG